MTGLRHLESWRREVEIDADKAGQAREAFGGSAALMVACGRHHMMVVTADGRLWTFGIGAWGYKAQADPDACFGGEVWRRQDRDGGGG